MGKHVHTWEKGSYHNRPKPDPFDPKWTRSYLAIPAIPLAKWGTDRNPLRQWSYPSRHRRRRLKLEKSWQKPTPSPVDSAGFGWRHNMDLDPQLTLIFFGPTPPPETAVLAANDRWKACGLGSSIRRCCRTWELTVDTIRLSVVETIRPELSGHRWPARVTW